MKQTLTRWCVAIGFTILVFALPRFCFADPAVCHVVDSSGRPVVGATVYVYDWVHIDSPNKTVTDSTGSFTVDASPLTSGQQTNCMIVAKGCASSGGVISPGDNSFQLPAPDTVTGTVVDNRRKPIAGAIVTARSAWIVSTTVPRWKRNSKYLISQLKSTHTTTTDAKGVYVISDVPVGGTITIGALAAGFVLNGVLADKVDLATHPIILLPGTYITGKVIGADGKGAAGVNVSAISQAADGTEFGNNSTTGTDGSYNIEGLADGTYSVQAYSSGDNSGQVDWVAPGPETVVAAINKPGVAPDIDLAAGVPVSGTVLDSVTKKPIPYVLITIQQLLAEQQVPSSLSAVTDSNGTFSMRVWAGQDAVYVSRVPDGYAKPTMDDAPGFVATAGSPVTLPPILLTPGLTVSGTAVDNAGNPIPNLTLRPYHANTAYPDPEFNSVTSDVNGQFALQHLPPGTYFVDPGRDWTVVSPATFSVPLTSLIKWVFKKVPETDLAGTVVDLQGYPVPNVSLGFTVVHTIGNDMLTADDVNAISDSSGKFDIPNAPPDPTLIEQPTAVKQGYLYQSGGDITMTNGRLSITPFVLAQFGGSVVGTVRNGLGEPVAGAWVYSTGSQPNVVPVQTDASGYFALNDLELGSIDVFAAKQNYAGDQIFFAKAAPGDNVSINLNMPPSKPTPMGLAAGLALLTQSYTQYVATETDHTNDWSFRDQCAADLSFVNHDAALNFLGQYADVNTGDLESIISNPTTFDPVGTSKWAIPLLRRTWDNGYLGASAAPLGLAIAPYDQADAKILYTMAAKSVNLNQFDDSSYQTAAQFVALAYAIGQPNADDLYQKLETGLDKLLGDSESGSGDLIRWTFAEQLALGNPELAIQYLSTVSKTALYEAVPEIIRELSPFNPTAALSALHALDSYKIGQLGALAYDRALCNALPLVAKSDPQSAVDQAKAIMDPESRSEALTNIADSFALVDAAPLYRLAEAASVDENGMGCTPAAVAAHAFLRDKELGKELFAQALDKEMAAILSAPQGQHPDLSEFAFYYSRVDPGFSRLLLEKQFAADLRSKAFDSFPGSCVDADVVAMATIDINRAEEMLSMIKEPYGHFAVGTALAAFVLIDQKTRDTLSFSAWMSSGYIKIPLPRTW